MKSMPALMLTVLLTGCGPTYAPPGAPARPCTPISESEFDAALRAGATRGDARIAASGVVDMMFGPGPVHCATYSSAMRPCRRPNDLVMRYGIEGGETLYVRVPAESQYRFRAQARPTTCEIVNETPPGRDQFGVG